MALGGVAAMRRGRRLGFVLPRYGDTIVGGAEALARLLAIELSKGGDEIEILTTCAMDHRSWENLLPAGEAIIDGMRVRRFPVDLRDLERWIPLQIRISEGMRLDTEEELDWITHSVNSTALYEHIARESSSFDALFFAPYLFGTTFWGSQIDPVRSFLIPCLHDENYAYLDIMGAMFRRVRGAVFNALPEMELACKLYGDIPGGEVGMGFVSPDPAGISALKPYFADAFPYILYFGRKETGKNVQLLIDHFVAGKERGAIPEAIRLVVAGGGSFSDLHRPDALKRPDIIDLERMSDIDKQRLYKHALVVCQPSVNESFSIILMESWQLGTPVLVNADCPVTRHHAITSGGGLYFSSAEDFAAVVRELSAKPALRASLQESGRRYVDEVYSWPSVLERFDTVMKGFGIEE